MKGGICLLFYVSSLNNDLIFMPWKNFFKGVKNCAILYHVSARLAKGGC